MPQAVTVCSLGLILFSFLFFLKMKQMNMGERLRINEQHEDRLRWESEREWHTVAGIVLRGGGGGAVI